MDPQISPPGPSLDALRQELLDASQALQLPAVRRAARRHRRRGLAGGCVVILAVVGVFAGVLSLHPGHRSEPAVAGRAADTTRHSQSLRFGGWSTGEVALSGQTSEGVALQERCLSGGAFCEARVQLTHDLGRTWQPGGPLPDAATGMLSTGLSPVVLNPAMDVLVDDAGRPVLDSGDLGQTWRRVPARVPTAHAVAGIDSGPRWTVALNFPVHGADAPAGNSVLAYDLTTGTVAPLAHQPPIPELTSVLAQGTRIWAAGRSLGPRLLVAISEDGGRTWRRSVLPGTIVHAVQLADVHGNRAVLLGHLRADADRWSVPDPLSALWTTDDTGRTFTEAEPRPDRPRSVSAAQILSDGEVVVVDDASPPVQSLVPAPSSAHGRTTLTASPTPTVRVSLDGGQSYRSIAAVSGLYQIHRVPGRDQLYGVAGEAGLGPLLVTFRVRDGTLGSRQARLLP